MSPILVIVALGAIAALILFGISGPSARKTGKRRLTALKTRHRADAVEAQMRRIIAQRDSSMDDWFQRLIPRPALLTKRLEMTGRNWSLSQYSICCGVIALVLWVVLAMRGTPLLLTFLIGVGAGLGLPHLVVGKMIQKRIGKFTVRFPDAIELLVRGLRSGLPVGETMGVVASEVPGPVGVEFRAVCDKMRLGRTMDQALQETADRLGTAEFQFFVISLAIQRETGGNLAETLSNLADVLRKRAQMKLKVKAMSSEAKASAWIIGVLPFLVFLMISFINPTYMHGFFTDNRLILTGLGGMAWMGIGVFIMSRMISFEI